MAYFDSLLLRESRRTLTGQFLVTSVFHPENAETHRDLIRQAGLEALLYRDSALGRYRGARWQVTQVEECRGLARPTPTPPLPEGAGIDGLPVAGTTVGRCTLVAR